MMDARILIPRSREVGLAIRSVTEGLKETAKEMNYDHVKIQWMARSGCGSTYNSRLKAATTSVCPHGSRFKTENFTRPRQASTASLPSITTQPAIYTPSFPA